MPAIYVHHNFGKEVLKKLNTELQESINTNIKYYNMFNQGFDNLFYYLKKWNYYKDFAVLAHKQDIDKFFLNMIGYIKDNNLINDSSCTNMLYGFTNHIIADNLLHPYVNYQVINLGINHTKIEFMLDYDLLQYKGKIYNTILPRLKFTKSLNSLIDYTFYQTHHLPGMSKIFNKSHNNNYYIYRYFMTDKSGFKTNFYKVIDFIFWFKKFKLHENTFYVPTFNEKILNKEHTDWYDPNNKEIKYNYSFDELFDIATTVARDMIILANNVLNDKVDVNEFVSLIKSTNLDNTLKRLKR